MKTNQELETAQNLQAEFEAAKSERNMDAMADVISSAVQLEFYELADQWQLELDRV